MFSAEPPPDPGEPPSTNVGIRRAVPNWLLLVAACCVLVMIAMVFGEASGQWRRSEHPFREWRARRQLDGPTAFRRWPAAQNEPHTLNERIYLDEYDRACALALRLATMRWTQVSRHRYGRHHWRGVSWARQSVQDRGKYLHLAWRKPDPVASTAVIENGVLTSVNCLW